MGILDYVRRRPPVAAPMQAAMVIPDESLVRTPGEFGPGQVTTDPWGMPDDLPLPVSSRNGVFVPATAEDSDLQDYDPWTWAIPAKILDDSRPAIGPYGEPSTPGKSGALVAEWGGMPYPLRDYQDVTAAVAYSPRQVSYHESSGPAGRFYGPQQTAWEANAQTPVGDYWSTVILGAGG